MAPDTLAATRHLGRHQTKVYSDPTNPQSSFAALMVCDEADAACPLVKGNMFTS
jgi:hypothetical protein